MAENAMVRSRISADIKDQATTVLASMGLTISDVMRIVLTRVAKEGTLPFDLSPNKVTRETLHKSTLAQEVPGGKKAGTLEELFEQLGI